LRILVIDDHPLVADALRRMLEHDGHRVSIALGGREGLDIVRTARSSEEEFDVVVADYNMPDLDGLMVAAAVKEIVSPPAVVLITASAVDASETPPAHVDAMLTKQDLYGLRTILARIATLKAPDSAH
jgi:CheY-like chemotaxis protein